METSASRKVGNMVTRSDRLAGYVTEGTPDAGRPAELLCTDHIGTYVVPFPCRYENGMWRNIGTGERIEAEVVGWRAFPARAGTGHRSRPATADVMEQVPPDPLP